MTKVLSKWYIHISLLLVTTITFCVSVNMKTAPKEDERVSFFVGAIDTKKDDLEAKLDSKCDDDILAIYYHFHNIYASNFTFIYSSFRENCDFFILPINYVNDYKGATINYSANLDIEYLNDYFDTKLEYCLYDGVAKGFKVYDHVKDEGILKNYITYLNDDYKSDYYLFFQFKSINIGEMNSVSKTNNALKVIKELMEL